MLRCSFLIILEKQQCVKVFVSFLIILITQHCVKMFVSDYIRNTALCLDFHSVSD